MNMKDRTGRNLSKQYFEYLFIVATLVLTLNNYLGKHLKLIEIPISFTMLHFAEIIVINLEFEED